MKLIGISRVRNEALIIADTVRHMERFCDGLIFYDDFSEDDTVAEIERAGTKIMAIVKGTDWKPYRIAEETRHRKLLYALAREFEADWLFCFDADERFEGDVRGFVEGTDADGVRVQLFDAYLTAERQSAFARGDYLEEIERMYGPERRDILMLWKNSNMFFYEGLDQREPVARHNARIITAPLFCKHFGKGISVVQWEETCDYYEMHFPEPYKSKYTARRGKAIHLMSDFGTPLHPWESVRNHAICIHPDVANHKSVPLFGSFVSTVKTRISHHTKKTLKTVPCLNPLVRFLCRK